MKLTVLGGVAALSLVAACAESGEADLTGTSVEALTHNTILPNHLAIPNSSGWGSTVSTTGGIDLGNPYFQDLGTNGRRCVSCHLPTAGWSVTPPQLREVFNATLGGTLDDGAGLGAIFRTNDGANAPNADVSTLAKRKLAYSMLLNRGLIRVGLPIPANAEFELVAVDDPYHFASESELSLFRRPLPVANDGFLSTVMWDGRETVPGATIDSDLETQANSATVGHAQGIALGTTERTDIREFEQALFFAQVYDNRAGDLAGAGAQGGPDHLSQQGFHIGVNDNFCDCIDADNTGCRVIAAPLGSGTRGAPFTSVIFNIYDSWTDTHSGPSYQASNRRAVARGQVLFNTFPITISGVSGLNDEAAFGAPPSLVGTCGTCHDSPNIGHHSVVAPFNIGLTDESRRTADMPLYTLRNKTTGEIKTTTDPGRALITGKWKHVGRFKGPILRGLASRAPYFHNGFAADLDQVIDFYNDRFNMKLSTQQHGDLVAFLRTL
ncbi:hypothetical protein BH11MYX1_BH11MYX1_42860 [soil metagenome]